MKALWAALLIAAASPSLFGHARGMGTLDLHEQGRQLLLTWVFYYDELPPEPALPDGSGRRVSLTNPEKIEENLGELAKASFNLSLGNQAIHPSRISQLLVRADKTCLVILVYPVPQAGRLELRAPILRLLPVNYLINVRYVNPAGKTTSLLLDRSSPPLDSVITEDLHVSSLGHTLFWEAFMAELGTAWLHTNWILLVFLLVLFNPLRRVAALLSAVLILRTILVYLHLLSGFGLSWRAPVFLLCLPILVLAWLAAQPALRRYSVIGTALGATLLFTFYDLQFLLPVDKMQTTIVSAGFNSGFAAGMLLGLAIILAINIELERFLRTHREWRSRLCWGVAGISLWISIYSLVR